MAFFRLVNYTFFTLFFCQFTFFRFRAGVCFVQRGLQLKMQMMDTKTRMGMTMDGDTDVNWMEYVHW